jgi:hypothetical protein
MRQQRVNTRAASSITLRAVTIRGPRRYSSEETFAFHL